MDAQKIDDKLTEQDSFFKQVREKLTNIELRQSHASGETSDASRAVHAFATGESSCMPEQACKTVCKLIMAGESTTYWLLSLNKDIRRCENELYKFFDIHINNDMQAAV